MHAILVARHISQCWHVEGHSSTGVLKPVCVVLVHFVFARREIFRSAGDAISRVALALLYVICVVV